MTTTCTAPDGNRRRGLSRCGRELAIVLVLKAIALTAIWQLWFAPPSRPHVDAAAIGARVYSSGAPTPAEERHARP